MGDNQLNQSKGADVLLPPVGKVAYYTDSSGSLMQVDSAGTVSPVGGGVTPSTDAYAVLAAPAKTLVLSGLDGDTAGDYLVDGCFITVGAAQHIQLLVNGAATNLRARVGDTTIGSAIVADWTFGNTAPYPFGTGTTYCFMGRLSARTGRIRQLWIQGLEDDVNAVTFYMVGQWTDTAANLTSLTISADNVGGLNTGSYLRLTPLNTSS